MTKIEYIQLIEIAGRVEDVHDNIGRINDMIESRFIQELIYKEIVSLEEIARDILLFGM